MNGETWREWRMAQRQVLLTRRRAIDAELRAACDVRLFELVRGALSSLAGATLGLYWPVRGEPDMLAFADLPGVRVALPVVRSRDGPVEFHAWSPGEPLLDTGFGARVPATRRVVQPGVLLVPLLGFDAAGYRLGYGSGYYDRTLAAANPRPFAVGVGYETGRLDSIAPRPHDRPMDLLVTERGVQQPVRTGREGCG